MEADAHFKSLRAPFGPVKLHYHTGTDIRKKNSSDPNDAAGEPVYAIAAGRVIGIYDPPPQRRIIVEHRLPDETKVWSVYVHIIDEKVIIGQIVDCETIIARLMNARELDQYGREYNHVHLEIMKTKPARFDRFYQRETFTCYSEAEVDKYFYDPELFLKSHFQ